MPRRPPVPLRLRATVAIALAVAAALAVAPAAAALYKWTDANGRVVYSDQPPPGDAKAEVVKPVAPPANPNAVKEIASKDAELKQRQSQRAEQEKKEEKARADAARKEDLCTQVRGQLKTFDSGAPMYKFNDKGDRVYLEDADRQKEAERLKALQKQHCPG
jgi:hypothetical protein